MRNLSHVIFLVLTFVAMASPASATIFGQNRTFTYDARGIVTNNGRNVFAYDFANQPLGRDAVAPETLRFEQTPRARRAELARALTGPGAATYAYDGNLKRVKEVRGGKTVYTVFSRVTGGLIYRDEATDAKTTDYVNVGGAALRLKHNYGDSALNCR